MMLQRWNYTSKRYEPFEVPDDREVTTLADAKTEISCACCGARLPFELSYTSLEIHTPSGIGYAVCRMCHESEIRLKLLSKKIDEERKKFDGKTED